MCPISRDRLTKCLQYPSRYPSRFGVIYHVFLLIVSKRLRVYTLHNSKKAVTADLTNAVTAFSIYQEVSLCIFPVGYSAAIQWSFL